MMTTTYLSEELTASAGTALLRLSAGGFVLVVDGREEDSQGVFVLAAAYADASTLRRFADVATGLTYLALSDERCEALGLHLVAAHDDSIQYAPQTTSIAARDAVGSGVSLSERARAIALVIAPSTTAADIRTPGPITPLRARSGGVLERSGPTEAAVDLTRLAGLTPAAVIGDAMLPDGSEAIGAALFELARRHGVPVVTMAEVIATRRRSDRLVRRIARASLPTVSGAFEAVGYQSVFDDREHLALVHGAVDGAADVLVYIHLACWQGDVFGSRLCDCRARLDAALSLVHQHPHGVIVHLAQDRYLEHLQRPRDDVLRDFGAGAQILADLGVRSVRVLTDHPRPLPGLEGYGLHIAGNQPLLGHEPDESGDRSAGPAD